MREDTYQTPEAYNLVIIRPLSEIDLRPDEQEKRAIQELYLWEQASKLSNIRIK